MKSKYILADAIRRAGHYGVALAGLVMLTLTASASGVEVLPPSSLPYGYSYEEWSAKWWEWSLGQPTNHLELVGEPGICSGPASRVRFLNGVYLPVTGGVTSKTNHVTIDSDTPLFFTILSIWVDNSSCPTFTSFTANELAAQASNEWTAVTETSCTIDGEAVAGLENPATTEYLVQSPAFSYTTSKKDNVLEGFFGEPCIPGDMTIYPAVAQGVYLMVAPLKPGKHTIHFVGVVAPGGTPLITEEITFDIEVL